jgi:hypothetical protein
MGPAPASWSKGPPPALHDFRLPSSLLETLNTRQQLFCLVQEVFFFFPLRLEDTKVNTWASNCVITARWGASGGRNPTPGLLLLLLHMCASPMIAATATPADSALFAKAPKTSPLTHRTPLTKHRNTYATTSVGRFLECWKYTLRFSKWFQTTGFGMSSRYLETPYDEHLQTEKWKKKKRKESHAYLHIFNIYKIKIFKFWISKNLLFVWDTRGFFLCNRDNLEQ